MKKRIYFLIIFIFSSLVWARRGTESSGGGGAAVCRDLNRQVSSAQILDLYEGNVRFGYQIQQKQTDSLEQLNKAMSKISDRVARQLVKQAAFEIMRLSTFLPAGVGLAPTTDLGDAYGIVVPDGCLIEPIGFYENDGLLKISRSVFNALSLTDQAAFILHESVYKMARNTSDLKDSASSRQLVGALFSENASTDEIDELLKEVIFKNEFLSPVVLSPIELANLNQEFILTFTSASPEPVISFGLGCLNAGPSYVQTVKSGSVKFIDSNLQNPCQALYINAYVEVGKISSNAILGSYTVTDLSGKILASGSISEFGSNWWAIPILRNNLNQPNFPRPQ